MKGAADERICGRGRESAGPDLADCVSPAAAARIRNSSRRTEQAM